MAHRWAASAREDRRNDAALLLPRLRGAVPADDRRTIATVAAYTRDLTRAATPTASNRTGDRSERPREPSSCAGGTVALSDQREARQETFLLGTRTGSLMPSLRAARGRIPR